MQAVADDPIGYKEERHNRRDLSISLNIGIARLKAESLLYGSLPRHKMKERTIWLVQNKLIPTIRNASVKFMHHDFALERGDGRDRGGNRLQSRTCHLFSPDLRQGRASESMGSNILFKRPVLVCLEIFREDLLLRSGRFEIATNNLAQDGFVYT